MKGLSLGIAMGAAVALIGCTGDGGAEGRGDAAYGAGRYQEALAAYAPLTETTPSARLWAKVGASALHLGQLRQATEAYRALAAADLTRADEAAEGLERVIQAAERRLDQAALEEAVAALRQVAPGRSLGRHALILVQGAEGPVAPADLAAALASAPEPGEVDSILLREALAYERRGDCGAAIPLFRAAARRAGRTGSAAAEAGLVGCYLRLGTASLPASPDSAEGWFRDAAALDSTSTAGRGAMIGLGDARARQGDLVGAALAYQVALSSGEPDDSLSRLAARRLNALASATPADSLSGGAR